MQYTLKTLAAAAALAVVGVANAAPTTINAGGEFNGTILETSSKGALSFSASLIEALNAANTTVESVAPATVVETTAYDPDLEEDVRVSSTATAPISSVTLDDGSYEVLSVATAGGAKMTAPKAAGVSLGGTLEVTNLNVDLTNKRVYASITGNFTGVPGKTWGTTGGAITTLDNFYLWDFAAISGPTTLSGPGTYVNAITGLSITESGFDHFVSALRLQNTGKAALAAVTDFGVVDSTINVSAVPEPSTYAMVFAGLAMVGVAARRARKA